MGQTGWDENIGLTTKKLDLVRSFSEVHGWSLWFALCNAFSPHSPVNKSKGFSMSKLVFHSANHGDHPCTFGKS
ncbi:hypothetical protein Hanom_Chr02g00100881 [Helianthus anomalus]